MTCYLKHLQEIFKRAGIEITDENKREVDKLIHSIVNVRYKDCPATWKEVKKRIAGDKENFASELKEAWNKRMKHL